MKEGRHFNVFDAILRERTDNQRLRTQSNKPNLYCLMPFLGDFNDFGGWELPFQACAIDTIDADCALRSKTGYVEFGYFHCYLKMDAPRALVFRPLVKGNEALGTRLPQKLRNPLTPLTSQVHLPQISCCAAVKQNIFTKLCILF